MNTNNPRWADYEDVLENYRAGMLTYDDARFELEQLGYSTDDAIARLDWAG